MKALAIAATGMSAQQLNVEVVANNIANINTTSYKRSRAEFTDLFYQIDRMQSGSARGRYPKVRNWASVFDPRRCESCICRARWRRPAIPTIWR